MTTSKSKFPALVVKEAKMLRKLTTDEEKLQLNIHTLSGSNHRRCIYGQITGHCYSERAKELIEASCSRVYNKGNRGDIIASAKINGSPKEKFRPTDCDNYKTSSYFSPIEVFLIKERRNTELLSKLVAYIKGERKSLR